MAEAAALVRDAAPELPVRSIAEIHGGWDSRVVEVDGEWIFRFPRDAGAEEALRKEILLLPLLATALPVAVPQPEYVVEGPRPFVGYRKVGGLPLRALAGDERALARAGRDFGSFLTALHSFPLDRARSARVGGGASAWREDLVATVRELERRVLPLLPTAVAGRAIEMLRSFVEDDASFAFDPALVHYDLGPAHLFFEEDGRLRGVIDWADTVVGDPAADLAWALSGTPAAFAGAVPQTCEGARDEGRVARARFFHRVGPWHEVVHGLDAGDEEWVRSGLRGVVDRLPAQGRAPEPRAGR